MQPASPLGCESHDAALLQHPLSALIGRVLLTLPFWGNGVARLGNFDAGAAEMEQLRRLPGTLFNVLVIARCRTWLGVGMLAVFTLGTIFIVHRFWALDGILAIGALQVALEHLGIIGGLLLATILAVRPHGEKP